jgi:hypothetical protein
MAEHAPRLPEDELAFVGAYLSRRLGMRRPRPTPIDDYLGAWRS